MKAVSFAAGSPLRTNEAMSLATADAAPAAGSTTAEKQRCPPFTDQHTRTANDILRHLGVPSTQKTKSLHTLVATLAKHHRPMKLVDMASLPELSELSLTTVYRLAAKLNEGGMFRRLGGDDRAFYYLLRIPGSPLQHYLTCTVCGSVREFATSDGMMGLRQDVLTHTHWRNVRFELELFGTCPRCQAV